MIEIIDITPKQRTKPDEIFGYFGYFSSPKYPELKPDDILFAYCSGPGSQGEKANYVITRTAKVYRVDIFVVGSGEFIKRVCPFLKKWDYDTMPYLEYLLNPNSRFIFKRYDWCWLGLSGAHSLFIHASMAAYFAQATKDFSSSEMHHNWLPIVIGLVKKKI